MGKINDEIAHYDIAQLAAQYSIQQQEYENEKTKLADYHKNKRLLTV